MDREAVRGVAEANETRRSVSAQLENEPTLYAWNIAAARKRPKHAPRAKSERLERFRL